MHPLPPHLVAHLNEALNRSGSAPELRRDAFKWARFYWDFCRKYGHDPFAAESLPLFHAKLALKGQSGDAQMSAAAAVRLLLEAAKNGGLVSSEGGASAMIAPQSDRSRQPDARCAGLPGGSGGHQMVSTEAFKNDIPPLPRAVPSRPGGASVREDFQQPHKPEEERSASSRASWVVEYDQLRASVRVRNDSERSFAAYRHWVGAFQAFVRSKPPGELSGEDVKAFLTYLAVKKEVAASTQNQAFNALLFFFRHVLGREFGEVKGVVRAKRRPYVPVTLSKREVEGVAGKD